MQKVNGGVCAPRGFKASGIQVGIGLKPGETPKAVKNDVGVIYSSNMCTAAAVYTRNKVKGAPILVTKDNIMNGNAQAVIVNSKNANTCNADGVEKARAMCEMLAEKLMISPNDVIVASTGVIGQPLDITPIKNNMDVLTSSLFDSNIDGSDACAHAIMTTDTRKKEIAFEFEINGKTCYIGGIAKGSGMIHPNMATMLCFLTTDVNISAAILHNVLSEVTVDTFNMVSVDGDTSTNDMACILANGMAENDEIEYHTEAYDIFKNALFEAMKYLSREMARDGEGATKLLECVCSGAPDKETARIVAKSVITSSLLKSAMFGEDANWGRILCAIGYADAKFDINSVNVSLVSKAGKVDVCQNGSGIPFSEGLAKTVLMEQEIQILVDLNFEGGNAETATAWGCDLTYDYVKINGSYRS